MKPLALRPWASSFVGDTARISRLTRVMESKLRCRDRVVDLARAVVMGVLNVTPDSFSDGGRWIDREAAVRHALRMAADGAGIIDVGGESTRPGAEPVPEEEELRRVLPVVEALAGKLSVPISIDTRKAAVAERAVEAGATIVNDESGEDGNGGMDRVVAESGAGVIVMHTRGEPRTMRSLAAYADLVSDVKEWLADRAERLQSLGARGDSIVVDPGLGFAKSADQSLELLRRIDELAALGYPVLAGTSRKSFIGRALDLDVHDRVEATGATVAWAVTHGVQIVRVHDVAPMVRMVRMTEAIARPANRATLEHPTA